LLGEGGPASLSSAALAPVFKPLFSQVKRLPCGAAAMVSSADRPFIPAVRSISNPLSNIGSPLSEVVLIHVLHVYVVFRHYVQNYLQPNRKFEAP
jgi:hypothetical protein